jgi:hypothetical protein
MGFWSTVKEKFLDPIGAKYNDYYNRFQAFQARHPRVKGVWNVLTHPTTVRAFALIAGIAAAPFTGGFTLLFAVEMSVTFAASLISVVAKGMQLRRLEKLKLQRSLVKTIASKQDELNALRADHNDIFKALGKGQPQEVDPLKAEPTTKMQAFVRTIRDVGFESLSPAFFMATATGPIGLVAYSVSLAFGVSAISKEVGERMRAGLEKSQIKKDINEVCAKIGIQPDKSLADLRVDFKNKIIDYETTKRTCEICKKTPSMSDPEIRNLYEKVKSEVAARIEFNDIPADPNFLRSTWHAVRPWGERYDTPDYLIPADKLVSYTEPYPPKPDKPTPTVSIDTPAATPRVAQEKEGQGLGGQKG